MPLSGTMENGRTAYIFFSSLAQGGGLGRMTSSRMTKCFVLRWNKLESGSFELKSLCVPFNAVIGIVPVLLSCAFALLFPNK